MNNPFDEFIRKDSDLSNFSELSDKIPEELKQIVLLGILISNGTDPLMIDIITSLLKHGCPTDAIVMTMDDVIKKHEKEDKPDAE